MTSLKSQIAIPLTLPNQLSVLRIILSPVFLYLFLSDDKSMKIAGFVVYMIASFTDWYDGWHARRFGVITKTGIFLDPLADKILVSFAFIAFYLLGIMPLWMMIVIVIRDIVITLLRSYKESKGITLKTSYIAKVKTFVQMTYVFLILLIILLIALDVNTQDFTNFLNSELNYIFMLSVTLLTVYTGITYFFENK